MLAKHFNGAKSVGPAAQRLSATRHRLRGAFLLNVNALLSVAPQLHQDAPFLNQLCLFTQQNRLSRFSESL